MISLTPPRALRAGTLAPLGLLTLLLTGCGGGTQSAGPSEPSLDLPQETHLRNIRQLTFSGENAEAYFSGNDEWLIFQGHEGEENCDQIYVMDTAGSHRRLVSTGKGRTTCGYIFPGEDRLLFSSTHLGSEACPLRPDYSLGYVWPVDETYDIFTANWDGSDLRRMTETPGYDAEATISRKDGKIVFTSVRDGDLDIYTMEADGSAVRRLTDKVGYDGGPFFSFDGSQIVYRAHYPTDPEEIADYQELLREGLIRPTKLELYVMDSTGENQRQVTRNGAANFAPFFHPDGDRIIFSSNMDDPAGREFDLYMVRTDGAGLERITHAEGFDGFPMFSSDGKKLVFGSNRNAAQPGDTNVFIADWVE